MDFYIKTEDEIVDFCKNCIKNFVKQINDYKGEVTSRELPTCDFLDNSDNTCRILYKRVTEDFLCSCGKKMIHVIIHDCWFTDFNEFAPSSSCKIEERDGRRFCVAVRSEMRCPENCVK